MSVIKRIIKNNIEKMEVDELLADEYDQAGYGGISLTKTPLGTQINLFAMRPGRVIGKRGRAIKEASERLERELGLPNPQITVVEVEVPELNPRIMAARVANALERGVHYRRALFWSLRRSMESGALGCEIILKGKLRSDRSRYEKVSEGYIPKSGDPALKYVKSATIHVKMKKGTFGVTVIIVPPDSKFPDKVDLSGLPEIEYPEEELQLSEGVEPEPPDVEILESLEISKPPEPASMVEPVHQAEGEQQTSQNEDSKIVATDSKVEKTGVNELKNIKSMQDKVESEVIKNQANTAEEGENIEQKTSVKPEKKGAK
jgi:small subunit ribosomal protein S3